MMRRLLPFLILFTSPAWAAVAMDTASGFPLTTTHANADGSSSFAVAGVTTAANAMVVAVLASKASTGFPFTIGALTGCAAWTLDQNQGPTTGTFANAQGVYIWHCFSTGGVTGQTVTATANLGNCCVSGALTIYSLTGASSTIGSSAGQFTNDGTTGHPLGVAITASSGSFLIAGTTWDNNVALTALANSTRDSSIVDAIFEATSTFHLTALTSGAGSVTFGASGNNNGGPEFTSAGVEVLVGGAAAAPPARSLMGVGTWLGPEPSPEIPNYALPARREDLPLTL